MPPGWLMGHFDVLVIMNMQIYLVQLLQRKTDSSTFSNPTVPISSVNALS